jgi:hypothetical protein
MSIPWRLVEENLKERGSYLVILYLEKEAEIHIGALVGSVLKGLLYLCRLCKKGAKQKDSKA